MKEDIESYYDTHSYAKRFSDGALQCGDDPVSGWDASGCSSSMFNKNGVLATNVALLRYFTSNDYRLEKENKDQEYSECSKTRAGQIRN